MTSRSSSSKGLVRDGVRRSLWAVVLSTLTFFMSMLLPSLMEMQHALENRRDMITSGALSFDVDRTGSGVFLRLRIGSAEKMCWSSSRYLCSRSWSAR